MFRHHFEKLFSINDADDLIPALEVLIRDLQFQAATLRERIQDLVRADEHVDSLRLPQIIERQIGRASCRERA